jgi:pimeloyl-ACP methyl ester carboxylesterase
MSVEWQLRSSGPDDADRTVLLLPGGMCGAGSWAEVMAQPALSRMRLVAATLPGHAGAPPPEDYSVETYAELTAELAERVRADVIAGFSMGACVAVEMATSGRSARPTVLLGVSLSTPDEPAAFRAVARLGDLLGPWPASALIATAKALTRRMPLPADRRTELRDDFAANDPNDVRRSLREYVRWLARPVDRADRLCRTGLPTWVVHAEKGDGGLTDSERRTLEACPRQHVVTVPGAVLMLPNLVPGRIADVLVQAAADAG